MGYWAKEGNYVYDANDERRIDNQQLNTTGSATFDERMDFAERQKSINPYGEPIKATGNASFDERVDFDERQKSANPYGEPIKITGSASFDERMDFAERQKSINPYGEPIKTTGSASFDERMDFAESQVRMAAKRDEEKLIILNDLMNSLPTNKEELISKLEGLDYRLDFIKKIVEHYRDQFLSVATQLKNNFTQEASEIVNAKLTEYLCLIETLKSQGYNFGSEFNSYNNGNSIYYDSNKPNVMLEDIRSIMHIRRRNDSDVNIIFPIDYDLNNEDLQKGDSIIIINNVNEHLKNNPSMNIIWEKSGYIYSEDKKRTM